MYVWFVIQYKNLFFAIQALSGGFENWPWNDKNEGTAEKKYKFALTSIKKPKPKCIGLARRRIGRGGRYEDFIM